MRATERHGTDPSLDDLTREVALLRARVAELEREKARGKSRCLNEIEQLRQARESLELASLIVENSPAVLFRREADEAARLVYVSENVSQWGYDAEEFLEGTLRFQDIILPEDNDRVDDEIQHLKERDVEEYAQEYRIVTREGCIRWISDETSVVRDERGGIIFNQGVLMDVTARKEAEAALVRSEYKFRMTIEGAGEGYILMDRDIIIREVNEAYCRMLGYDRDTLLGKRPIDFATLEYQRFLEANGERLLRQDSRCFEGTMVHQDGHVVPVLINAHTLRGQQGEFLGHVAFVADLTGQKKAVELAGEVQKSLLPDKAPALPGLDIAGASVASEIAGGDYYDYLEDARTDQSGLSVAVGDISGHGVDAALLMTTARGFLRMRAAQPGTPAQIVTEMNRHLAADLDGSGRFMTLFYLRLDPENQSASWVRAGHDPAMIYCPRRDMFSELGQDAGLPLGVTEETQFVEESGALHPGQIIAIGTDGIWEARSISGEMFGKDRFRAVIRRHAAEGAGAILDAVYDAVREYTGGARPEDDITLVVVKYGFDTACARPDGP